MKVLSQATQPMAGLWSNNSERAYFEKDAFNLRGNLAVTAG